MELYSVKRLQQGMKINSAILPERTVEALKGLTGIIIFKDDVLTFGNHERQSSKRSQAARDQYCNQ